MKRLLPLILAGWLTQPVIARVVEDHSEERLLREADLVVEALPVWGTTESFVQDVVHNAYPHEAAADLMKLKEQGFRIGQITIANPLRYSGFRTATTFRVVKVLKGSHDLEKLVVYHFQGPFQETGFHSTINSWNPIGVTFDPASGKIYRLYLHARPWGVYQAASGDDEPYPSFREIDPSSRSPNPGLPDPGDVRAPN